MQMMKNTKVTGRMIKEMVKERILGQMDKSMQVIMLMVGKKGMD